MVILFGLQACLKQGWSGRLSSDQSMKKQELSVNDVGCVICGTCRVGAYRVWELLCFSYVYNAVVWSRLGTG
jgi:hypothetical protein